MYFKVLGSCLKTKLYFLHIRMLQERHCHLLVKVTALSLMRNKHLFLKSDSSAWPSLDSSQFSIFSIGSNLLRRCVHSHGCDNGKQQAIPEADSSTEGSVINSQKNSTSPYVDKESAYLILPPNCVANHFNDPSLEILTSSSGKGPPPTPPINCCMSACTNCVWLLYAEELKTYYADGGRSAKEAIEEIENPSLKAFLKLELGF